MGTIRKIHKKEIGRFNEIVMNAYPGFLRNNKERKKILLEHIKKLMNEDERTELYGYFDKNDMQGGMRILDLKMNFRGIKLKTTGIGLVAVDLINKKKKIARDMLKYYLELSAKKKSFISTLYPFRPDFYNRMGYGYGTPMHRYSFAPSQFPYSDLKHNTVNLTMKDKSKIIKCYNDYQRNHHGLFDMSAGELDGILKSPAYYRIGYMEKGVLKGVMIYRFHAPDIMNEFKNDIYSGFFIYNTPDALKGIMGYLHTQKDQINNVVLHVQDGDFFHAMEDARFSPYEQYYGSVHKLSDHGVMVMYRIVDLEGLFKQAKVQFGTIDLAVRFIISDSFLGDHDVTVQFKKGRPSVLKRGKNDVTIRGGIDSISSVIMGAVELKKMIHIGRIDVSRKGSIIQLNNAFKTDNKPLCMTGF